MLWNVSAAANVPVMKRRAGRASRFPAPASKEFLSARRAGLLRQQRNVRHFVHQQGDTPNGRLQCPKPHANATRRSNGNYRCSGAGQDDPTYRGEEGSDHPRSAPSRPAKAKTRLSATAGDRPQRNSAVATRPAGRRCRERAKQGAARHEVYARYHMGSTKEATADYRFGEVDDALPGKQ